MQERSEAERRAIMAMPQCCYLAKGAKRPSHTTNTIKFDRIPFDLCNSIKRFDLCPFDQKNSTYLQPPVEPKLQRLERESFEYKSTCTEDEARLDIRANGLWDSQFSRRYFDVKMFNPLAKVTSHLA